MTSLALDALNVRVALAASQLKVPSPACARAQREDTRERNAIGERPQGTTAVAVCRWCVWYTVRELLDSSMGSIVNDAWHRRFQKVATRLLSDPGANAAFGLRGVLLCRPRRPVP